jgi:hypothetical protein
MQFLPDNKTIFLAKPEQLTCPHCYLHLFLTVKSLTHLSSAGIITAIEVLFRDAEYNVFKLSVFSAIQTNLFKFISESSVSLSSSSHQFHQVI